VRLNPSHRRRDNIVPFTPDVAARRDICDCTSAPSTYSAALKVAAGSRSRSCGTELERRCSGDGLLVAMSSIS